jgi:hypothetical protein
MIIFRYIGEIQGTESLKNPEHPNISDWKKHFPYYFLTKQMHFEKLTKGNL